jgi:hypothetical protein
LVEESTKKAHSGEKFLKTPSDKFLKIGNFKKSKSRLKEGKDPKPKVTFNCDEDSQPSKSELDNSNLSSFKKENELIKTINNILVIFNKIFKV